MDWAFIATKRKIAGRSTLSIRTRYANGAWNGQLRLSSDVRLALHSVIESAGPVVISGLRKSRSVGTQQVLIATPLIRDGFCYGTLAVIGHIPAPYVNALRSIRRLATMLDASKYYDDIDQLPLGDFIRGASARQDILLHELRVPLSAASLLLESLMNEQVSRRHQSTVVDPLLHDAYQAIQDARGIVRHFSQLLTLNQGAHPISTRPVQVGEIVNRAIALLPDSKGCLRYTESESLPDVAADPLWLTHALTNLLENTIIHAPAAYAVDITAATTSDESHVVISITSFGAGISAAEQAVLMRPYRRRSPHDDLTSKGLGLSIVQYLVTEMSGDLRVQSDGRHSATFCITLPTASH
jgi:signal transduction histidine kinase